MWHKRIYQGATALCCRLRTAVARPSHSRCDHDRIITAAGRRPILWEYSEQTTLPHESSAEDGHFPLDLRPMPAPLDAKCVFWLYALTDLYGKAVSLRERLRRSSALTSQQCHRLRLALVWGHPSGRHRRPGKFFEHMPLSHVRRPRRDVGLTQR